MKPFAQWKKENHPVWYCSCSVVYHARQEEGHQIEGSVDVLDGLECRGFEDNGENAMDTYMTCRIA